MDYLRFYLAIYQEGLRKTTRISVRIPDMHVPPEYKAEA
jgi:hypothetical protein